MYQNLTCLQLYLGIWLHCSRGTFPQILLGACLQAVSAIWRQLGTATWRQTSLGTDWQSFWSPPYPAWSPPAAAACPYPPWHSLMNCVSHLFSYSVEQRSCWILPICHNYLVIFFYNFKVLSKMFDIIHGFSYLIHWLTNFFIDGITFFLL